MAIADTRCELEALEHDLPLLAPMEGGGLSAEIIRNLAQKPKDQPHFVDSPYVKVRQTGQGVIGGSKNKVIGLTKSGHNPKLRAAFDERGDVVARRLFPSQCAETTAAKELLPRLANTMVFEEDIA